MAGSQTGVVSRWLGMELRRLREAARLSLDTVAAVLDWSPNTLSRLERGLRPETTPEEVSALLAAMKVMGDDRVRIMRLAHSRPNPGLWEGIDSKTTDHGRMYQSFEAKAKKITSVEPLMVPGLLQTADYCRAVLTALRVDKSVIMSRMSRRLGRQDQLLRSDGPEARFVIGEGALRRPLPTRLLMAQQLRHIMERAVLPSVSVRVLPDSVAHPCLRGSLTVLEFTDQQSVVHVEGRMSGLFPENPAEIDAYMSDVEATVDLALSEQDSRDLLSAIVEDLERAR